MRISRHRGASGQRGERLKGIARAGERGGFVHADQQNIHASGHLQNFLGNCFARLRTDIERDPAAERGAEIAIVSQGLGGSAAFAKHFSLSIDFANAIHGNRRIYFRI
jgi:hypothetical protein